MSAERVRAHACGGDWEWLGGGEGVTTDLWFYNLSLNVYVRLAFLESQRLLRHSGTFVTGSKNSVKQTRRKVLSLSPHMAQGFQPPESCSKVFRRGGKCCVNVRIKGSPCLWLKSTCGRGTDAWRSYSRHMDIELISSGKEASSLSRTGFNLLL